MDYGRGDAGAIGANGDADHLAARDYRPRRVVGSPRGLFLAGFKTKFGREILMFLGLISVIYIIQDTASGPSLDLRAFEEELRFFPAKLWMFIWLAIALGILALNLRMLWREDKREVKVKTEKPRKKAKAVK